jgi:RNA polymerase sigma-70 factor, ECF subfamily
VNFPSVPEGLIQEVSEMTASSPLDTEQLLTRAGNGDAMARQQLLTHHRDRLRRMVALRLDRRLTARVDASDIVQESLAEAHQRLSEYLRDRPLPFYAWLRQFAWERVAKQYERHVKAQRRSVTREARPPLPDESVAQLAHRLIASATSPSRRLLRDELRDRVRTALGLLKPVDREVLVLRYLEGLSNAEAAAVLGLAENTAGMRHLRALERLRALLGEEEGWGE